VFEKAPPGSISALHIECDSVSNYRREQRVGSGPMKRMALLALACVTLSGGGAAAQPLASGDEVKAAFADKTAYITHRNGNTQKAYFAADGTAKVTESKGTRAGTWTVEKNTICHNLSSERKCYTVSRKSADTVELQSTDFKWMPLYRLVAGNPEKL
jgi:hypothetical protein